MIPQEVEGVLEGGSIAHEAIEFYLLINEEKFTLLRMQKELNFLLLYGEKPALRHEEEEEEDPFLHRYGEKFMIVNDEEEEVHHHLHGVDGLLLPLILHQVIVMNPAPLLNPTKAIIHEEVCERNILPGSALEK